MKKVILFTIVFMFVLTVSVFADSSGSFSATGSGAACVAKPATYDPTTDTWTYPFANGTLDGGMSIPGSFTASVQTPSGNGTTLLIRPSLNTGLFTNTKITSTVPSATADVGIQVCVYSTNLKTGKKDTVYPTNCVVYDQRIQQISSTLFQNIASCTAATTACGPAPDFKCPAGEFCGVGGVCYQETSYGSCSTNADCAAYPGTICVNGQCTKSCSIDLLQTTLSAHSFDFVVPVSNGNHRIDMEWKLIGDTTHDNTQACVGPGAVTVQQVKNFQNNSQINYTTP